MLGKYYFVGPDVVSHGQDVLQVAVESKNTQVVAAIATALKVRTVLHLENISTWYPETCWHIFQFSYHVNVWILIKGHVRIY
jgi:hypothetical protein